MNLEYARQSRMFTNTIAMTLFTVLALPVVSSAQEEKKEHHHYKLVVVEPLGGPGSVASGPYQLVLNNRGTFVAYANTATPNPNAGCLIPFSTVDQADCFVEHPVVWHNGTFTNLSVLPGGNNAQTTAITANGLVVGFSENGLIDPQSGQPEGIAVLWANGKLIDLGTLPQGTESIAIAANSRGQVVGFANNGESDPFSMGGLATQTRAFLWQNGAMRDLGTLGGPDSIAFNVNERGQAAGQSYTNSTPNQTTGIPTMHPFFWENGKMVDVGTLGGTFGGPNWMNNRGQIVGFSNVAGDQSNHAFLWDKEHGLKDLGTLPGGSFSGANWINDDGEIVGASDVAIGGHGVLWKNGAMIDLGLLPGDCNSEALAINSQGQIVGNSSPDCVQDGNGVLWENGRAPVNLNTLVSPGSGVSATFPIEINDRGEIAAHGQLSNGDPRAVLLIPCDESHPDVAGCDYDSVKAENDGPLSSAQIARAPAAASTAKLPPTEMSTRLRSLTAKRTRRFGIPQVSQK